jgi:hypothetical protein
MEKIDSVALELIPFCAKLLRKSDAKVLVGDDVACLQHNPSHPTYSIVTLRNLFIYYLYLFKWVKWDPFLFPHGTLSSDVLGSVGRLIPWSRVRIGGVLPRFPWSSRAQNFQC